MLFRIPDQLPEEKKEKYIQLTMGILQPVIKGIAFTVAVLFGLLVYLVFQDPIHQMMQPSHVLSQAELDARARQRQAAMAADIDRVEDGIHVATGLVVAPGWEVVRGTCTACHSAALVTQNRATRDGWTEMIRWMQAKQGLWDLGPNEKPILDYLAANYAPQKAGRRPNIDVESIEWYILEL